MNNFALLINGGCLNLLFRSKEMECETRKLFSLA